MTHHPLWAHYSPIFDPQLLISPFELTFVRLFVVVGVYYATIIISKARQTCLALLCSAEVNNYPHRNRELLGLLDKVYVSYFSFVLLWLFAV